MSKQVPTTENEMHDLIKASFEETNRPYDGFEGCWAGDGSGFDCFADYNQNEGLDY